MATRRKLSHVAKGRPRMVDVSAKDTSLRSAVAECTVEFPEEIARMLHASAWRGAKGPVLDTAVVAGVMAAKRTHELIPFCHPLGLEVCRVDIAMNEHDEAVVRCTAAIHHRTGVEMEALTGASIAALTIYDMCKALSHEIVIVETRLLAKRGGRHDIGEVATAP